MALVFRSSLARVADLFGAFFYAYAVSLVSQFIYFPHISVDGLFNTKAGNSTG